MNERLFRIMMRTVLPLLILALLLFCLGYYLSLFQHVFPHFRD